MTEQERTHRERMLKHAKAYADQTYSCPICGEDITVQDRSRYVQCSDCEVRLRVDRDAQFEGGLWHDLTRLVPI